MEMDEALEYMYGLQVQGVKLGLENTKEMLARLGNPQEGFRSIHVAGTNGKGSACAMMASILQEAGYSVGLYTSPHLMLFNERIVVNREQISDTDLSRLAAEMREHAEAMREDCNNITFFEFTTALAFKYFAEKDVDVVVAETGMGGRLDSTNVLEPDVTVITNIGIDHTEHLGHEIEDIAGEKAGIIKPGIPVVTSAKGPALEVVMAAAMVAGCMTYTLGNEIKVKVLEDTMEGSRCDIRTHGRLYEDLAIPLAGLHQTENTAVAIAALEEFHGIEITEEHVRKGISATVWPARFQVLWRHPYVILDCAHNISGARVLADSIERYFPDQKRNLLFGMLEEKAHGLVTAQLAPLFEKVYVTLPSSDRALDTTALAAEVLKYTEVEVVENPGLAYGQALDSTEKDQVLVIAGSIYLAGQVLGLSGKA